MKTIQVQIPDHLYQQIKAVAEREDISIDMIVSMALSEHLTTLLTPNYLEDRAKKGSWERFQKILAKVPIVDPEECDRLDQLTQVNLGL